MNAISYVSASLRYFFSMPQFNKKKKKISNEKYPVECRPNKPNYMNN